MIKGIFLDVFSGGAGYVQLEDTLENFYDLLECGEIKIDQKSIGYNTYSIVYDAHPEDKEEQIPSAFVGLDEDNVFYLNNIFICKKLDENGNLQSLDDKDVEIIKNNLYETKVGWMLGLDN